MYLAVLVVLIRLVFFYFFPYNYDTSIWYGVLQSFFDRIPYLTTSEFVLGASEYPVVFTYFLLLVSFLKYFNYDIFSFVFGTIQSFFYLGSVFLLLRLLKDSKRILFGFVLMPTVIYLGFVRFDLMPCFFILLAIYFVRNVKLYSLFISVATNLKIYPISFIISLLGHKKINWIRTLAWFALFTLLFNIPVLFKFNTLFYPISNPFAGPRPESIYWIFSFLGVEFPSFLKYLLLGGLLCFAFFGSKTFLGRSIAIVISLIVTSNIFSPQWNIWILPLLLLTNIRIIWIVLFELVTIIEFPLVWTFIYDVTSGFSDLSTGLMWVFIALNLLRYSFFLFFYFKCVLDRNLVNEKFRFRGIF